MNSKQIRNELGSDIMSKLHLSELHESCCFWINYVIHYNLVKDYDNGNSCREYGDFTNCTGKWQLYVKKCGGWNAKGGEGENHEERKDNNENE